MSVNHDLPTIIHSHVLTVQQYSITCVYMYAACADYCKLENFEKLYLSECDAITDKMLGRFGSFKLNGFTLTI